MIKRLLIFAVVLLSTMTNCVFSQAPNGVFRDIRVLDNFDTVNVVRTLSPWWFGVSGGGTVGMSFSDFKIPDFLPENGQEVPSNIISYNTGYSGGAFIGLYGEWLPVDEMWGVVLRINLLDFRNTSSESEPLDDSLKTQYKATNKFKYLTISPSARYNLPIANLYLFAGADLEFILSKEILTKKEFKNSADITHDKIVNMNPNSFRAAFNFGIGYDIFAADINKLVRAYISPFVSFHIGTNEISEFGSSRIPFLTKFGTNIKFNIDEQKYDTVPVNKDYIEPPQYIATYRKEKGVSFAGFKNESMIAANLLDIPKQERIIEDVKPDPVISVTEKVKIDTKETMDSRNIPDSRTKKNIIINPNSAKIFYYPSSESSILTKVQREYLDALVDYMKKNPDITVRISGHSDNAGTTEQNQKRSENRAFVIVQYLLKKDIIRRRILDRGRGALEPIADNNSEKGRGKNRRVEIQVVK